MHTITRAAAADTVATDVLAFAHRNRLVPTFEMCQARLSELRGTNSAGTLKGAHARIANARTVWRLVRAEVRRDPQRWTQP